MCRKHEEKNEQGALTLASPEVRFELDDERVIRWTWVCNITRNEQNGRRDDAFGEYCRGGEDLESLSFALLRRHPEPREKCFFLY